MSGEVRISEPAPDRIVIENLRVDLPIGVRAAELARRQTVRFDIEIDTHPGYASRAIASDEYLSYGDVVEFIEKGSADGGHVRLVEEWAERIAAFVLQHPLATAVDVRVVKTEVFANADGVGIRIVRRKA